ncbi:unnamed protein product [Musa hybrid cultivar]
MRRTKAAIIISPRRETKTAVAEELNTTRPQCDRFGTHHQILPSPLGLTDTINALLVMELADASMKKTKKDPCLFHHVAEQKS